MRHYLLLIVVSLMLLGVMLVAGITLVRPPLLSSLTTDFSLRLVHTEPVRLSLPELGSAAEPTFQLHSHGADWAHLDSARPGDQPDVRVNVY